MLLESEFYRLLAALYADMPQGRMPDGFRFFLSMFLSASIQTAGCFVAALSS